MEKKAQDLWCGVVGQKQKKKKKKISFTAADEEKLSDKLSRAVTLIRYVN